MLTLCGETDSRVPSHATGTIIYSGTIVSRQGLDPMALALKGRTSKMRLGATENDRVRRISCH